MNLRVHTATVTQPWAGLVTVAVAGLVPARLGSAHLICSITVSHIMFHSFSMLTNTRMKHLHTALTTLSCTGLCVLVSVWRTGEEGLAWLDGVNDRGGGHSVHLPHPPGVTGGTDGLLCPLSIELSLPAQGQTLQLKLYLLLLLTLWGSQTLQVVM